MSYDELFWRRVIVSGGGMVYWLGVYAQGRRIRRRIGRSPNLKPRGARERLLWAGWMLVVGLWIVQPWLARSGAKFFGWQLDPAWLHPVGLILGALATLGGYAATLWCYAIMGNAWRIGINRKEKNELVTTGPYQCIRHPIYAFQTVMLLGAALLIPTVCSLFVVILHLGFVMLKARDEEAYLLSLHGAAYQDLMARTGRLFPKFW